MADIEGRFFILKPDSKLEEDLLDELYDKLADAFDVAIPRIKEKTQLLIEKAIRTSPEARSLINNNGLLRKHFGIEDASEAVGAIIKFLQDRVEVIEIAGFRSSLGGISVRILEGESLYEMANMHEVRYASVNIHGQRTVIPWLYWLLFEGGGMIISDYAFVTGLKNAPTSRTGSSLMLKSHRGWQVPMQFAGTENDNWIIRSFEPIRLEIESMIGDEVYSIFD